MVCKITHIYNNYCWYYSALIQTIQHIVEPVLPSISTLLSFPGFFILKKLEDGGGVEGWGLGCYNKRGIIQSSETHHQLQEGRIRLVLQFLFLTRKQPINQEIELIFHNKLECKEENN